MNVLHLVDGSAGWEQRVALQQLHERLPPQGFTAHLATIESSRPAGWPTDLLQLHVLPRRLGLPTLAGPAVRRFVRQHEIDLVHAWGADAAAAARAADLDRMPLAIHQFDPGTPDRCVRILRTVGAMGPTAVICTARRVERRLVERGVPLERCVVIRPGVDFAALRAASRGNLRAELGLNAGGLTVLAAEGPVATLGHRSVVWSGLMQWYLDDQVRVIVPGVGPGQQVLRRLADASDSPQIAVFPGSRATFEDLAAVADVLVLPTTAEIPATSIAWAMAAGATVIAAASYSTAEMLSTNVNAVLYKQSESWRRDGARICAAYQRRDTWPRLREVARGQAYEVFSVQRMVRQVAQLYRNLQAGTAVAEGITDPAQLAS